MNRALDLSTKLKPRAEIVAVTKLLHILFPVFFRHNISIDSLINFRYRKLKLVNGIRYDTGKYLQNRLAKKNSTDQRLLQSQQSPRRELIL